MSGICIQRSQTFLNIIFASFTFFFHGFNAFSHIHVQFHVPITDHSSAVCRRPHIWNSRPRFVYLLYKLHGATMKNKPTTATPCLESPSSVTPYLQATGSHRLNEVTKQLHGCARTVCCTVGPEAGSLFSILQRIRNRQMRPIYRSIRVPKLIRLARNLTVGVYSIFTTKVNDLLVIVLNIQATLLNQPLAPSLAQ